MRLGGSVIWLISNRAPPPVPLPPLRVVYSVWPSRVWYLSGLIVNTDLTRVPTPNTRKSRSHPLDVWIMCSGVGSISRVTVSVLYWVCGRIGRDERLSELEMKDESDQIFMRA